MTRFCQHEAMQAQRPTAYRFATAPAGYPVFTRERGGVRGHQGGRTLRKRWVATVQRGGTVVAA